MKYNSIKTTKSNQYDLENQTTLECALQDEILHELATKADELKEIVVQIDNEVKMQNKLIDSLGDDLIKSNSKLGIVNNQLNKVITTVTYDTKWVVIVILFVFGVIVFI